MNPERWREIDALAQAAFDYEGEERQAFLAAACAGRPELRREVRALLEADTRAEALFDRPAGELDLTARAPRPRPGARFGAYELLEEIGYGGFCRVYRARRVGGDFSRLAAVKVVDPGLDFGVGDDTGGDIVRRFRTERQILAELDHPSISRLLDGGEQSGRPYVVMEYVDGRPIDVYCAEAGIDLDARLRLMLRVIDAVAYAHEHLIVHRDLKPGNLLVTPDGEPKLLDFGIAKVLGAGALAASAQATRSGLRPMTPAWAAPEQVRGGAVTTATDVYGLGLLLYLLLTGERAYDLSGLTPAQVERVICDTEPTPPSGRVHGSPDRPPGATPARLEGDLDAIVLTALAADPRRRYRSARQLAEDLERHLRSEPVTARPATPLYRAGKWLRRHRWGTAAALLAAAVLTVFVTALVLQSRRLEAERDLARQESSRAEEVRRFLVEIFAEADPGRTGGRDLSVRRILERGEGKIDTLDEPAARAELLATLGSVYAGLGDVPEGAELLRRARRETVSLHGTSHPRVAEIDHRLGEILVISDRFREAERAIPRALELRSRLFGDDHPQTAESRALLGRLRLYQGYRTEAEALLSRALPSLAAGGAAYDEARVDYLGDLATVRRAIGADRGAVIELMRQRLRLARERLGPRHPLVAVSRLSLAYTEPTHDRRVARLEEVAALLDKIVGPDHPDQARLAQSLAVELEETDPQRALELTWRAIEIDRRVWGEGTWALSLDYANLARIHDRLGDVEKSDHYFRRALAAARSGVPPTHPWLTQMLFGRAMFLIRRDRPAEAADVIEQVKASRAALAEPSPAFDVVPLALEALVDLELGEPDAAARLLEYGPPALPILWDQRIRERLERAMADATPAAGGAFPPVEGS